MEAAQATADRRESRPGGGHVSRGIGRPLRIRGQDRRTKHALDLADAASDVDAADVDEAAAHGRYRDASAKARDSSVDR